VVCSGKQQLAASLLQPTATRCGGGHGPVSQLGTGAGGGAATTRSRCRRRNTARMVEAGGSRWMEFAVTAGLRVTSQLWIMATRWLNRSDLRTRQSGALLWRIYG
jgi:hypothetical protein